MYSAIGERLLVYKGYVVHTVCSKCHCGLHKISWLFCYLLMIKFLII